MSVRGKRKVSADTNPARSKQVKPTEDVSTQLVDVESVMAELMIDPDLAAMYPVMLPKLLVDTLPRELTGIIVEYLCLACMYHFTCMSDIV
jgi:hypothetical protein